MAGRPIVGIAADNHRIFAICGDGTLWMQGAAGGWSPVEAPAEAVVEPPPEEPVVEGADVADAEPEIHKNRKGSHHGR